MSSYIIEAHNSDFMDLVTRQWKVNKTVGQIPSAVITAERVHAKTTFRTAGLLQQALTKRKDRIAPSQ